MNQGDLLNASIETCILSCFIAFWELWISRLSSIKSRTRCLTFESQNSALSSNDKRLTLFKLPKKWKILLLDTWENPRRFFQQWKWENSFTHCVSAREKNRNREIREQEPTSGFNAHWLIFMSRDPATFNDLLLSPPKKANSKSRVLTWSFPRES